MRTVLSENHYGRHLESPDEQIEFARTAPIEAGTAYWDAADALHSPGASVREIEISMEALFENLVMRAGDDPASLAAFCRTRRALNNTVEQAALNN
jgi:hypothetical protein